MALSTFASFMGSAKESTYGTPVAATLFTPSTELALEDVKNYTSDSAMRGSAVDSYNQVPTQGWATYSYGFPVYMDTVGVPLKGILGAEDLSGAGPYTHVFSTLNTGTYQPPSYTLTDYNGFNARQLPGFVYSQVEFSLDPTGLLVATAQGTGLASATATKPTQSFSTKTALAGYKPTISIGGSATTLVESMTLTIARSVNPITAVNASASPSAIWAGSVAVSGSITAIYNDDAFLTPMLSGSAQAIDVAATNGADSLTLHCTQGLFTRAPVTRGGNGWMEISIDFTAVANTTDANTAGTGYSPVKATLINTSSAAF